MNLSLPHFPPSFEQFIQSFTSLACAIFATLFVAAIMYVAMHFRRERKHPKSIADKSCM